MSEEFKPIETQDAFDAAIKSRLERNTRKVTEEVEKKYEGYLSPEDVVREKQTLTEKINALTGQLSEKETTISELTAKAAAYELNSEKMRIAHEAGIPFELAERLSGQTAEELKADAQSLARFTMTKPTASPEFNGEKPPVESSKSAYMEGLAELKK